MRIRPLLVAVLVVLIPTPLLASEENAAEFVKAVLAKSPVTQEPCKEMPEGAGAGTIVACGKVSSDFQTFEAAWDKAVKDAASVAPPAESLTPWQMQMGGWIRWYTVGPQTYIPTGPGGGGSSSRPRV